MEELQDLSYTSKFRVAQLHIMEAITYQKWIFFKITDMYSASAYLIQVMITAIMSGWALVSPVDNRELNMVYSPNPKGCYTKIRMARPLLSLYNFLNSTIHIHGLVA